MAGKQMGGDKQKREKMNKTNPRGDKKGGRKSKIRGKNTFLKERLAEKQRNESTFSRH